MGMPSRGRRRPAILRGLPVLAGALVLLAAYLGLPTIGGAAPDPASSVIWSATHESADMSDWTLGGGGGIFNSGSGTARASDVVAHSGRYSAAMSITNASNQTQAVRLFRWGESRQHPEAYYSAWYYFPQGWKGISWWNVFQFKSKLSESVNDPLWVLNVGSRSNGEMYFYLFDWINRKSYNQSVKNIPVGQWFHLEAYYKQAADSSGQVTFWQDGTKIVEVAGVATRRPGDQVHWSVNNYTDNLDPSSATIYVDDAMISTVRVGGSSVASPTAFTPRSGASAGPQPAPQFLLGFRTLADLLGGSAGSPVESERHDPISGDGLQQTTTGLMAWRKADNWTAFTDGYRTWINGPFGLQSRLNTDRFGWEAR